MIIKIIWIAIAMLLSVKNTKCVKSFIFNTFWNLKWPYVLYKDLKL